METYLALATHSKVTSEVPETTLVLRGGIMMVGAMGSAGPPTSGKEQRGVEWLKCKKELLQAALKANGSFENSCCSSKPSDCEEHHTALNSV